MLRMRLGFFIASLKWTRSLGLLILVASLTLTQSLGEGTTVPGLIQVPQDFPTIQRAIEAAQPGDIIAVAPGTYREDPVVHTPHITLRATDRGQAVIQGNVEIHADGVHFEGFTVRGLIKAGGTVSEGNVTRTIEVHGVTIQSNHIEAQEMRGGIHLFGQLNVVEGNRIINHRPKSIGLLITGPDNLVRWNILENRVQGFEWGIVVRGARALIEGNEVIGFEYCIQTEVSSNNFILHNTVRGCGQAISLATATHPLQHGHQNVVLENTIEESHIAIEVGADSGTRIQGNEIRGNTLGIVVSEVAQPSQPLYIRGNNIRGNKQFGIKNVSGTFIDARHNWWGDAGGPAHLRTNPQGRGDRVSDDVAFRPWLTQPLPP